MKLQLLASVAVVLLGAVPGVFSSEELASHCNIAQKPSRRCRNGKWICRGGKWKCAGLEDSEEPSAAVAKPIQNFAGVFAAASDETADLIGEDESDEEQGRMVAGKSSKRSRRRRSRRRRSRRRRSRRSRRRRSRRSRRRNSRGICGRRMRSSDRRMCRRLEREFCDSSRDRRRNRNLCRDWGFRTLAEGAAEDALETFAADSEVFSEDTLRDADMIVQDLEAELEDEDMFDEDEDSDLSEDESDYSEDEDEDEEIVTTDEEEDNCLRKRPSCPSDKKVKRVRCKGRRGWQCAPKWGEDDEEESEDGPEDGFDFDEMNKHCNLGNKPICRGAKRAQCKRGSWKCASEAEIPDLDFDEVNKHCNLGNKPTCRGAKCKGGKWKCASEAEILEVDVE